MSSLTIDPRSRAIFEHASKLVGTDEPKVEIIKLLTEENGCGSASQHLNMLPIVGVGGMGKTTLENQVYQELNAQFNTGVGGQLPLPQP
jgi:Holliday junction resolvasome RuvABC ATP-dependent DNA helicase subunit